MNLSKAAARAVGLLFAAIVAACGSSGGTNADVVQTSPADHPSGGDGSSTVDAGFGSGTGNSEAGATNVSKDGGVEAGASWNAALPASECASDVTSMGVSASNDIFVAGSKTFETFPSGCRSEHDAFVAKFDIAGNSIGLRAFGYDGNQEVNALAVAPGGGPVVVGDFDGSMMITTGQTMKATGERSAFIAKLDPMLGVTFSKQFSSTKRIFARAVAVTSTGDIVVAGYYAGTTTFGGTELTSASGDVVSSDAFLAKFDANGNHLWSHSFGDSPARPNLATTGDEVASSVATDAIGNVYVVGYFDQTIDFDGNVLTNPTPSLVNGYKDMFLAKFDAGGNHVFGRRFGGTGGAGGYRWATSIALDGAGNVVIGGMLRGTVAFGSTVLSSPNDNTVFVAKLDPSGEPLWAKRFGDDDASLGGLALDASGNVVLAGSFVSSIDFGAGSTASTGLYDAFVTKLTATGTLVSSRTFKDSFGFESDQMAKAAAVDASGAVLAAGTYQHSIVFGADEEITTPGKRSIFVDRLAP